MSAYTTFRDTIRQMMPSGWRLVGYEPVQDLPDVTSVTIKVREVRRLPASPIAAYQVDWVVTITSPHPSRETADPNLFDDLIDFLLALDAAPDLKWLGWTEAVKTVGDDNERLAYDITITTHTKKEG